VRAACCPYVHAQVEELDKLQEQLMAENQELWNSNYTATTQAAALSRMLESQQDVLGLCVYVVI
jgi:hypothetical protein